MTDLKTKLAVLQTALHNASTIAAYDVARKDWIALTGSEANRAQIIAALGAVEEAQAYFEDIASLTENPLYNPLEVGFRHSPLSPKEREERYATACSMAWQSAQRGIALKGVKHGAD